MKAGQIAIVKLKLPVACVQFGPCLPVKYSAGRIGIFRKLEVLRVTGNRSNKSVLIENFSTPCFNFNTFTCIQTELQPFH
eukprot:jgi/Botrbrau1/6079/Bobra.177_1s0018.1